MPEETVYYDTGEIPVFSVDQTEFGVSESLDSNEKLLGIRFFAYKEDTNPLVTFALSNETVKELVRFIYRHGLG